MKASYDLKAQIEAFITSLHAAGEPFSPSLQQYTVWTSDPSQRPLLECVILPPEFFFSTMPIRMGTGIMSRVSCSFVPLHPAGVDRRTKHWVSTSGWPDGRADLNHGRTRAQLSLAIVIIPLPLSDRWHCGKSDFMAGHLSYPIYLPIWWKVLAPVKINFAVWILIEPYALIPLILSFALFPALPKSLNVFLLMAISLILHLSSLT